MYIIINVCPCIKTYQIHLRIILYWSVKDERSHQNTSVSICSVKPTKNKTPGNSYRRMQLFICRQIHLHSDEISNISKPQERRLS